MGANRSLFKMERHAYCNLLVIALTCVVSFLGFRSEAFEERCEFWPQAILAGRQYYRLITSGFLHSNGNHLLMNMISLYFFGPLIERVFGPAQFLVIYLAAMIGGDLLALYIHRHHDYRALGASGGVAGVIFAFILLFPGGRVSIGFLPIFVPSWLYAIGFLLYSFYGIQRNAGNIGHDAHIGGALVGLFTAAALHPVAVRYNPWLFAGISLGTILFFIYLARHSLFLSLEGLDFFHSRRGQSTESPDSSVRPDRQVDAILRKISESGMESLTEEEKELLKDVSVKYRRRAERQKPHWGFPF